MSVTKINKTYYEVTDTRLKNTSQLKSYPIFEDDQNKFMNIFRCFNLRDLDINYFIVHELDYDERWDNLAYQYYETARLWWMIPLTNNIENPFEQPEPETNVKILKKEYVYDILNEIRDLGEI